VSEPSAAPDPALPAATPADDPADLPALTPLPAAPDALARAALPPAAEGSDAVTPSVVDGVALARLYGEPLFKLPQDLYIPPDALEVFLEAFEGPLDLLLYLIRKQNFNVLDIPMAPLTK
jgi:segregation and condensation protein A